MEPLPEPSPEIESDEPTVTPPAVRYRMLSLVWCFPSLGALWLLGTGMRRWRFDEGALPGLAGIRVEEWIALLLIALHLFWLAQWWRAGQRR